MPKRDTQTQNFVRSTKSQRHCRDQEVQLCAGASSTNSSSDLSKDHPTNLLSDPQANTSADISENHVADPSMNSHKELRTELSVDTFKDLSTDNPKDSSIDSSKDHSKNQVTDTGFYFSGYSAETEKLFSKANRPFNDISNSTEIPGSYRIPSFSITATNVKEFNRSPMFKLRNDLYPKIGDLQFLASSYVLRVSSFASTMVNPDIKDLVEADEIDRIQQVFDEFRQLDPKFPPTLLAKRFGSLAWRGHAVQYITHWAIITNIAVDGDIKHTLLPPHIVALYRDLDHHSSDTHRILSNRWVELTFGLLARGHSEYQASAEVSQRIDRIRQFITKLLGPYCVQRSEYRSFTESLDEVLQLGVAIGYHLLGVAEQYRWDWAWLAPRSNELGLLRVGKPPPRPPPEEEVPEGIWITAPALVKETDEYGQQLASEITVIDATQAVLYPREWKPIEHWTEAHEKEFQKDVA